MKLRANIDFYFHNAPPRQLRYKPAPDRHVRFASSPPEDGCHHWATPETKMPFPNTQNELLRIDTDVISGTGGTRNS